MLHSLFQKSMTFFLVASIVVTLVSCTTSEKTTSSPPTSPTPADNSSTTSLANPASENCIKAGGELITQKLGDGSEYGVCVFEENRQCEEWAMQRGECPEGGRSITGYITEAAIFCAITGGEYQITNNSNTEQEEGTCTLKNGETCDVLAYFSTGECHSNTETTSSSYDDPFAYCAAVGTIDTPDEQYKGAKIPDSMIQSMIKQNIVAADAPDEFKKQLTWRCMNNQVFVCHFGANIPCEEKADTTQEPTSAMMEFCKTNPTDDIPAVVTGRATIYEWKCKDGKPEVGQELLKSDQQGFIQDFWVPLEQN